VALIAPAAAGGSSSSTDCSGDEDVSAVDTESSWRTGSAGSAGSSAVLAEDREENPVEPESAVAGTVEAAGAVRASGAAEVSADSPGADDGGIDGGMSGLTALSVSSWSMAVLTTVSPSCSECSDGVGAA